MPKKIVCYWIALVVILLLGSMFPNIGLNNPTPSTPSASIFNEKPFTSAGAAHASVAINGDANFTDTAQNEGWPGNGSFENPFIISSLDIDLGGVAGHCINISNTRVNFTIQNCNLTGAGSGAGIFLDNVSFAYLFNNTCTFNGHGIYLLQSSNNVLENNTCLSNSRGIYMYESDSNTVSGNDCDDNSNYGIFLQLCDSNLIFNNLCSSTGTYGIGGQSVVSNTFANNTCNQNSNGIRIWDYSSGNVVANNTCSSNSNYGIILYNDDYALPSYITNNYCSYNYYGINPSGSSLFVINNILVYCWIYGIFSECSESVISGNSILWSDRGIQLYHTDYSTISQNELSGNFFGFWLEESSNNIISENSILDNSQAGISIDWYSYQNTIFLNDISVDLSYFEDFFYGVYLGSDTAENNVSLNYINYGPFIYMSAAISDSGAYNIIDRNWYEEYDGGGYGYDGFWDTPYSIAGSASNVDLHPLVYPPFAPVWTEQPTTQIIDYWGQSFYYDLNATAPTPIAWLVNDTVHFTVSNNGVVQSNGDLPVGSYGVRIRVTNLYGVYIIGDFQLIVQEVSLPEWIIGPTDIVLNPGDAFETGLIVTDESGIYEVSIDDTLNFELTVTHLNVTGYNFGWYLLHVTNATILAAGEYFLNVTAVDPYGNVLSGIFAVTILETQDTTPPVWVITPAQQILPYGTPLVLQLAAWDASGISYGWVNDTLQFTIDESWIVRNATILQPGIYCLEVMLYDLFGNYCSANLTVTILEPSIPTTTTTPTTVTQTTSTTTSPTTGTTPLDSLYPIMTFALGIGLGGGIVVLIVILLYKKSYLGK
ncbi:MAG: right-handed parallel beta-helix repeat-containing protein [Promethearchaeota archaeon]